MTGKHIKKNKLNSKITKKLLCAIMSFALIGLLVPNVLYANAGNNQQNNAQLEQTKQNDNKVKVTFDLNYDGAPAPEVISVEKGSTIPRPADPQRQGYTFCNSWYKFQDLSQAWNFDDTIQSDITLYARWFDNYEDIVWDLRTQYGEPFSQVYIPKDTVIPQSTHQGTSHYLTLGGDDNKDYFKYNGKEKYGVQVRDVSSIESGHYFKFHVPEGKAIKQVSLRAFSYNKLPHVYFGSTLNPETSDINFTIDNGGFKTFAYNPIREGKIITDTDYYIANDNCQSSWFDINDNILDVVSVGVTFEDLPKPDTHTLTINYVDQQGNILHEPHVEQLSYKQPFNVVSPTVDKFTLVDQSQSEITGVMGNTDINIDVVYKPISHTQHWLTIQYLNANSGLWLSIPYIDKMHEGEKFKVESPQFNLYSLVDKTQSVVTGTMDSKNININVYYKFAYHWCTINYVNSNAQWIHLPYIQIFKAGDEIYVESPEIWGYVLHDSKDKVITDIMPLHNYSYNVVYKTDTRTFRLLLIKYVDENGWWLRLPYIKYVAVGDEYNVKSPEIEGYQLIDSSQDTISGTMTEYNVHVKVKYEKAKAKYRSLVIHYVDQQHNWLALPYIGLYKNGERYSVESPKIPGLTLVNKEQSIIEGIMGEENIEL